MSHVKRHLCLVSAQPTPNLSPLLDSVFRPEEVILLVSPDMQKRAEWLKQAIGPTGIRVRQWHIEDAWDIEHIRDQLIDLLDQWGGDSIALNATGGTKPMSIAAYEVFRDLGLQIFYLHPERDRLIWLHPADRAAFDIEDRIRLPQFLLAHGVQSEKLNRTSQPGRLKALTEKLIDNIETYQQALGALNYLAYRANGSLLARMEKKQIGWRALHDLIDLFADAELLERSGDCIRFTDEAARFYVNGGWLEQHLFSLMQQIRKANPHIQDLAQGLNVCREGVKNEIDLAFLCDNHLFLIECKTKRFDGKDDAHAVYKLDALTGELGGIQARSMLVSFQMLRTADMDRARKAKIEIAVGREIQQMESRLHQWIG